MKISSKQLRNHALSQLESLEKRFTELDQSRKRKNYSIKDTLNFVDDWQLFSSSLYQLRGQCSQDDPVYVDIEERSTFLSHAILNWREADKDEHTYSAWKNRYRSIWREHFSLFALCSALFVGSIIVSLLLVLNQPEYGSLLIPNHMLENIISGKRWFDSLNENPFFGALGLAFHLSLIHI